MKATQIESVNVTLTTDEKVRMQEQIVKKANVSRACKYADIHIQTFNKALDGNIIKNNQRDLLLAFCDLVEGKTAA